jgi:hypothetical protein
MGSRRSRRSCPNVSLSLLSCGDCGEDGERVRKGAEGEYAGGGAAASLVRPSTCLRLINDLGTEGRRFLVGEDMTFALDTADARRYLVGEDMMFALNTAVARRYKGCNCSKVRGLVGLDELPEPIRGSGLGIRTLSSTVSSSSGAIALDGVPLSK